MWSVDKPEKKFLLKSNPNIQFWQKKLFSIPKVIPRFTDYQLKTEFFPFNQVLARHYYLGILIQNNFLKVFLRTVIFGMSWNKAIKRQETEALVIFETLS